MAGLEQLTVLISPADALTDAETEKRSEQNPTVSLCNPIRPLHDKCDISINPPT